jgi:hypothetical protein
MQQGFSRDFFASLQVFFDTCKLFFMTCFFKMKIGNKTLEGESMNLINQFKTPKYFHLVLNNFNSKELIRFCLYIWKRAKKKLKLSDK